ncbi:hypothetical protein [Flavobacterium sp.]|uniref:hypothetical protein n=1 Tax=Flavobacterium sp. TaxID=239 RepID=UPI00260A2D8D|nr:hypothetical protein [Flavobacterium sp.]
MFFIAIPLSIAVNFFLSIPEKITQSQLTELNVKIIGSEKPEGGRNPYSIYLKTSEYKCLFGVDKSINNKIPQFSKELSKAQIKIKKSDLENLKDSKKIINLYYLQINNWGLIFDEKKFNEVKQDEFKETILQILSFTILMIVLFFTFQKKQNSSDLKSIPAIKNNRS